MSFFRLALGFGIVLGALAAPAPLEQRDAGELGEVTELLAHRRRRLSELLRGGSHRAQARDHEGVEQRRNERRVHTD